MTSGFTERRIELDGVSIRCFERGQGETIVSLHDESGAAPTVLEQKLAQNFRVVVLQSEALASHPPADGVGLLGKIVASLRLADHGMIAADRAAVPALLYAAAADAASKTLVLLSPAGSLAGAESRLSQIKVPTLVLVGTEDEPTAQTVGPLCAEHIPECYQMLVYDSGRAMADERPAALFEAVADFLERRGRFVLERQESVISP